ncbi:MAG: SGNH/GDSL hydrolase family protein [Marinovum sp.]|nr:SGNH/GDSL hydrolase family protein [Marinovum sp.]
MLLKTLALAPILVPQVLWVMARASRLPEAEGPRRGQTGQGPTKRLLVLGDSSAAGVGVAHQFQALSGQLANALSHEQSVTWHTVAVSGATARSTLATLQKLEAEPFDWAVIALGVNDVKNGVSESAWLRDYGAILSELRSRFGSPKVCASAVPNLGAFPLLPWPLSLVLGERAIRFDEALMSLISSTPEAVHLNWDFDLEPSSMAADGFHPGPEV